MTKLATRKAAIISARNLADLNRLLPDPADGQVAFRTDTLTLYEYDKDLALWATVLDLSAAVGEIPSPQQYGAVADAAYVDDIAITNGSLIATSPSAPWAVTDRGKGITIRDAGGAGVSLITTIASFQNAGQVTLAAPAAATVAAGYACWGTDDIAALEAMLAAVPEVGPNLTRFGPGCALRGRAYYISRAWVLDKPVSLYGDGAVIAGHTVHVGASNSYVTIVKDITTICSAAEGWRWERGQGLQSDNCRNIGSQGHGHVVGGVGSAQVNYGNWRGLATLFAGGHSLYLDAGAVNINANHFDHPVLRSSLGYGLYINDTTGLANYNHFQNPQIEGNLLGSVYGGQSLDNLFVGGHYVDNDDPGNVHPPALVMNFPAGSARNRLIGGRIIGATTAMVGVEYLKTTFSSGGVASSSTYDASLLTLTTGTVYSSSNASPEAAVTAVPGSIHARNNGGGSTPMFYVKASGSGNTGWVVLWPDTAWTEVLVDTTVTSNMLGLFLGDVGHTLTLQTAASRLRPLFLRNTGSGNWTIQRTSSNTIEGATSISLLPGEAIVLMPNGSNWVIVG